MRKCCGSIGFENENDCRECKANPTFLDNRPATQDEHYAATPWQSIAASGLSFDNDCMPATNHSKETKMRPLSNVVSSHPT